MRTAILLLLGCFAALGQALSVRDLALVGQQVPVASGDTFAPTNITGSKSWWVASDWYTNGSPSYPVLPDRKSSYNLTNKASAGSWPALTSVTLGSKTVSAMRFDGSDDYLRSTIYTSTQPHEIVMMFASLSASNTNVRYVDAMSVTARHLLQNGDPGADGYLQSYAGTAFTGPKILTNKWWCIGLVINGDNSFWHSNGVCFGTNAAGAYNVDGLSLGYAVNTSSRYSSFLLGEMATYNAVLSPTDRSNLVTYLLNKYPPQ